MSQKSLTSEEKQMISIFAKPNIILVVEGHEIHVEKTELIEKSPVFKKMLEKDTVRIVLPKQKLNDFLIFLRCTLSGIGTQISVGNAKTIIPVAHEYQAQATIQQAELVLSDHCTIDNHSSESIVEEIIFAETYNLNIYLSRLIGCASKKMFCFFKKTSAYHRISQKTLSAIALKRWEDNINPFDGTSMTVSSESGMIEKIEKLDIDPNTDELAMHPNVHRHYSPTAKKHHEYRNAAEGTYVANRVR